MATSPKLNDSLTVVNDDVRKPARLNCIKHLLRYYEDLTVKPIDLPSREKADGYVHPSLTDQIFVPEHQQREPNSSAGSARWPLHRN